jgi:hypothetical protein
VLALDWPDLDRRGAAVVVDGIGRECVTAADARRLVAAYREAEALRAQRRAEAEERAVAADQQWRAQLARGVPADAVPAGLTAAAMMMAADPLGQGSRRQSVLEHALEHAAGAVIFHSLQPSPGGES